MMIDAADIIAAYVADRSVANRNRVIEAFLPVVDKVLGHMLKHQLFGTHIDRDDLRSAGYVGLIRAVEKIDGERAGAFRAYAGKKVRGAILDACRDTDQASRVTRQRIRRWDKAEEQLRNDLNRPPSPAEVTTSLCIAPGAWHDDVVVGRHFASPAQIDYGSEDEDDLNVLTLSIEDSGPGQVDDVDEFEHLLRSGLLSERERTILRLRYRFGLPLKVIAARLGYSESRISQVLALVHALLRDKLAA